MQGNASVGHVPCKTSLQMPDHSVYSKKGSTEQSDHTGSVGTEQLREPLAFWSDLSMVTQGCMFLHPQIINLIGAYASVRAYGAWCQNQCLTGFSDANWLPAHINVKEVQAVYMALQAFHNLLLTGHILIQSDNQTVVAYINHRGVWYPTP